MGGTYRNPAAEQQKGSSSRASGSASSSGRASNSAPRSHASQQNVSRYDGNRDRSGSRSGTPPPPPSPSTQSQGSSRLPPTGAPLASLVGTGPRNFDMGVRQWSTIHGHDASKDLPTRSKQPSKLGQEVKIALNVFNVESFPTVTVYQHEVLIGGGDEKRGAITKVWESKALQESLGGPWLFDGNRLAWSLRPLEREVRVTVDLDREQGRTPRPGKDDTKRVVIRQTNQVRLDALQQFLQGTLLEFNGPCLEALNFLDHLLREHPSRNLTAIKRSFYPKTGQRTPLGGGVEALKGVYQSLRLVLSPQGPRLAVNVDVANCVFFQPLPFSQFAVQITGRRDVNDLLLALKQGDRGRAAKDIKKLRRVRVIARHRNGPVDEYTVDGFHYQSAKDYKFNCLDTKTGKEVSTTLYDYFNKKYGVRLNFPELPLVRMTKRNTFLPMEVLQIKPNQRYPFKLDERQTSEMIKVAVTPPNERWGAIQQGLTALSWQTDPYLKAYGLKINGNRTVVPARLLPSPKVQFGQGNATPGTSGRWDLKGKKFLEPNTAPLKSWSVTVISGRRGGKPDKAVIENFMKSFVNAYIGHGGRVENKQPALNLAVGDEPGAWVTSAWNAAGQQVSMRPQMLVFILPDKDALTYGRIKRSADCRYGVVSQCMQYAHVQKCQPQYISNVLMKFNAKLGGVTARAVGPKSGGEAGLFKEPTIVIGADVSHAAPGSVQPSMAAITVSTNKLATRFAAAVDTNGHRVEMLSKDNIDTHLPPILNKWKQAVGGGKTPSRVIYLRDGVSEKQYQHVLDQEVHNMKAMLKALDPASKTKFVVIIGVKRHHVRFFPEPGKGDRNSNPLPGTLIESGATHPFENDIFLCSHAAIKGTARPTHYQVILNEADMSNDDIYTMLYEQVYQYIRATTPVSIHPAIYYAHIASNRAVPHDPKFGASDPDSGTRADSESTGKPSDVPKLMLMPDQGGILNSMWYI